MNITVQPGIEFPVERVTQAICVPSPDGDTCQVVILVKDVLAEGEPIEFARERQIRLRDDAGWRIIQQLRVMGRFDCVSGGQPGARFQSVNLLNDRLG